MTRKKRAPVKVQCCLNNDTGCFDDHCTCSCDLCAAVRKVTNGKS